MDGRAGAQWVWFPDSPLGALVAWERCLIKLGIDRSYSKIHILLCSDSFRFILI